MRVFNDVPFELYEIVKNKFSSIPIHDKSYTPNDLLKPTRMLALEAKYDSKIVLPASSLIWTVIASSLHRTISDNSQGNGYMPIQKVRNTIDELNNGLHSQYGEEDIVALNEMFDFIYKDRDNVLARKFPKNYFKMTINGNILKDKIDAFYDKKNQLYITDTKFVNVDTYKFIERRLDEFTMVMNIRRMLFEKSTGLSVPRMHINFIFRDWNMKHKLKQQNEYPKPIESIRIDILSNEEITTFITNKLTEISNNIDVRDEFIVRCTDEERWKTKTTRHIFKRTQYGQFSKKAFAITGDDDEEEKNLMIMDAKLAGKNYRLTNEELLSTIKANYKTVKVEGSDMRCNPDFCHACRFCDHYKNLGHKI